MTATIFNGQATYDGAGVKLTRVFAHDRAARTDPFLLLDHFGSDDPADYVKGFPWHPHRGIETVTYMLGGTVEHGDSLGNAGIIGTGDIQWMTAGGGVIHQEMPQASAEKMHGLQLWVNLPAKSKMMAPRYRGILAADVPAVPVPGGEVKVIAGSFRGTAGPVQELVVDVVYLDVRLRQGNRLSHTVPAGYTSFCYALEGTGECGGVKLESTSLALFQEAGEITVTALSNLQYVFVSGRRLGEPIAWGGPIVMNTQAELDRAFRELDEGTFIKS